MADRVILEHELARERRIGVERHRRRPSSSSSLSARIAAAAAALLVRSSSSASSFVTASCSLAWRGIHRVARHSMVTPVTGLPPATVCASWISSG